MSKIFILADSAKQFQEFKHSYIGASELIYVSTLNDIIGYHKIDLFIISDYFNREDYQQIIDHAKKIKGQTIEHKLRLDHISKIRSDLEYSLNIEPNYDLTLKTLNEWCDYLHQNDRHIPPLCLSLPTPVRKPWDNFWEQIKGKIAYAHQYESLDEDEQDLLRMLLLHDFVNWLRRGK